MSFGDKTDCSIDNFTGSQGYWFTLRKTANAGSAEVIVRNERESRKSSASLARGADEDVRAPRIEGSVKLNQ